MSVNKLDQPFNLVDHQGPTKPFCDITLTQHWLGVLCQSFCLVLKSWWFCDTLLWAAWVLFPRFAFLTFVRSRHGVWFWCTPIYWLRTKDLLLSLPQWNLSLVELKGCKYKRRGRLFTLIPSFFVVKWLQVIQRLARSYLVFGKLHHDFPVSGWTETHHWSLSCG